MLLAMQTARAFSRCRPMLGNERRLIVVPSGRCSKDSSISTLSRYQVTFGGGLPVGILYSNCDNVLEFSHVGVFQLILEDN